ncbi:peptidylprolyl isomerase [Sphingobacteriaceae bacterium]|nr:peptidylprolyl isomerase [Sphingobacteriaceae bacterium]
MYRYLAAALLIVFFTTCKKNKTTTNVNQAEVDEKIITDYIAANKLNAKATGSGLYYVIKTEGTGNQAVSSSIVTVDYRGYLPAGGVFDQGSNVTFPLSNVIKGWQEGIPYFKANGGKGILLIPSALGYGSQAQTNIPANSVLIFDITLSTVK